MNKKTKYLLYIFSFFIFSLVVEVSYLYATKRVTNSSLKQKQLFVKTTQLPDLALSTEVFYIRHRSLNTIFNIYSNDSALREYELSTFTIASDEL